MHILLFLSHVRIYYVLFLQNENSEEIVNANSGEIYKVVAHKILLSLWYISSLCIKICIYIPSG